MSIINVKALIEFIVKELKEYKLNKATYELILNENGIAITAQTLSEVPRSVTNKFSSMTENQAFNNKDASELFKDFKRVDIWLNTLDDEERFAVENFYIKNRGYNIISHLWSKETGVIYTNKYWKRKNKKALCKICNMYGQVN